MGIMSIQTIGDRDYRMLETIDRLRIGRAVELAWLVGFTDVTYCRKRLAALRRMGLVKEDRDRNGAKCYYLTDSGLSEIGKSNSRVYEVSYTTTHALEITIVCVWVYLREHVGFEEMLLDTDMRRMLDGLAHRPDIVCRGVAYEVERSHKTMDKLVENIGSNTIFDRQVWVVPNGRKNIKTNLQMAADRIAADIEVVPMSQVTDSIAKANIHDNVYLAPERDPLADIQGILSRSGRTKIDKYLGGGRHEQYNRF